MFEVFGVVDLRDGLAVRARGGKRDEYMPIDIVAGEVIDTGDAGALVRHYIAKVGVAGLYVADLDAIERGSSQDAIVRTFASVGAPLWLDAGITSVADARRALDCGAARLIVGLETLPSFRVLASISADAGHDRVVFSLDLRDGQPITSAPGLAQLSPEDLVTRAADAGAGAVIVLDLARVGTGRGLDLPLIARLKAAAPSVQLFAGGGVRGSEDLARLRSAGCDGALVASALLNGCVTAEDISALNPDLTPST
jgi:phosphoribosylformimino-5-aminoimidazole carboxamide ribotide isomerase